MLSGFLGAIGGSLARAGIGTIIQQLQAARMARIAAESDDQKRYWDYRIEGLTGRLELMKEESGHREVALARTYMRAFIALPIGLYTGKILVWDKVLALGTTDDLSPDLWQVVKIVIVFYFGAEGLMLWRNGGKK